MARNYILGGMAGTQLQAGKPFLKRIIRQSSVVDKLRDEDNFTCKVVDGKIVFAELDNNGEAQPVKSPGWSDGELLMVEFPTTVRSVEVQVEDTTGALGTIRARVMLTAPEQQFGFGGIEADPLDGQNFIEIVKGDTATISSRTKVIFILIKKYQSAGIFDNDGGMVDEVNADGLAGTDGISLLITATLDHEPQSGSANAARDPATTVVNPDLTERKLQKIWGPGDGIG